MSYSAEIEARLEQMKRARQIRCPHCQSVFNDEEYDHVTYHGSSDSGMKTATCHSCEKDFAVREMVERTYETFTVQQMADEVGE